MRKLKAISIKFLYSENEMSALPTSIKIGHGPVTHMLSKKNLLKAIY
jgi:hypothetical protein